MSNQDQFSGNSETQLIEKSAQKKSNIEIECEEIDRISKLPQALIVEILSLLPITDAFRTIILSKDWQYFWTCINKIVYDNEECGRSDSSIVHKFISLMDNVLPILSFSTIQKFSLTFVFRYHDGVSYFPVIDKWLEFTVNKKVEDLRLNIRYTVDPTEHDQPYSLLEVLCSSSSILKLNYENCRILEDCVLNWTSIKSLTLEDLFLRDEHIK
uniref:F-box family protein n=1 Tax=Solanum tuberosum TaxID=4113 RepID=M1C8T9_SOLTU